MLVTLSRHLGVVCALLLMCLLPRQAQAQEAATRPMLDLNPESFYGKDPAQGVYVADSAVALERFSLATRMERLKEWSNAADLFQEVLEKFSDRVVPSQTDENNRICQYTSVAVAVQQRLSRWPAEGLNAYRAKYEPAASALLEGAGRDDFAALHRVCALYLATDSGKTAALRLIDLYLEAGEFPAAAWMADRLLWLHPSLHVERPKVLYLAGVAYHLAGHDAQARSCLEELQRQHPNATGVLRGADMVLANALTRELEKPAPQISLVQGDSWPMFGGSPDRARLSTAQGRPGARLFSIDLPRPRVRVISQRRNVPPGLPELEDAAAAATANPAPTIHPVADGGQLFFQDGRRIYAVGLDSGLPLPGWALTYNREPRGQYVATGLPMSLVPSTPQLTVTLSHDSVYAVLGSPDRFAAFRGEAVPMDRQTRIVCLDRQTGRLKWTLAPRQLPTPAANLRGIWFDSSPLVVVGDSVYVVGRGGKGAQFEDCYVLCLDAATGAYRWSSYIASSNTRAGAVFPDEMPAGFAPSTPAQLACASGRLYVLTNLGAVAALDAHSGTILWLSIYPRDLPADPAEARRAVWRRGELALSPLEGPQPWSLNPLIVHGGRVFAMPADGKDLLIYDAGSGTESKRLNLRQGLRSADTLLGAWESKVLVAGMDRSVTPGRLTVTCIDWARYDPHRPDAANSVIWRQGMAEEAAGRGFLTADSLFIPTEERLLRIGLRSGKIEETYPRRPRTWDSGEGPGNILVTQDHVVIASPTRIDVLTDLEVAKAKLDREVAAAASDPEPRLRYAEVLFVSGHVSEAIAKLDEAIELLGGRASLRSGPARDRLFNDALSFAQKLSNPRAARPDAPELIGELFDRAAAAASTPSQQVSYRMSRARFAHAMRDYAGEVRFYQEILLDSQQRLVPVSEGDGEGPSQAGNLAETAIAELIQAQGPACYAPFEQAAAQALQQAKGSAGSAATALLSVAQSYPNATTAPQAMMAAADAYESAGNASAATQVLRQLYYKYPSGASGASAPAMLEAMARNYLAMGNRVDVAISRLARAAKLQPAGKLQRPLRLPDGRVLEGVSFVEALAALRSDSASRGGGGDSPPDFHLLLPLGAEARRAGRRPFLPPSEQPVIDNVTALITPLRGSERYDRLVTWSSDSNLCIYPVAAPGKPTPLARVNGLSAPPTQLAWLGANLLVWNGDRIALVQSERGDSKPAWTLELKSLPSIEVIARDAMTEVDATAAIGGGEEDGDAEDPVAARRRLIPEANRRRAVIIRNGRLVRLGIAGVPVPVPAAPAAEGAAEQILHVRPLGEHTLIGTSTGRIVCIQTATGTLAWQTRLSTRPVDRLLASEDFAVARLMDDAAAGTQIVVLDSASGQVLSRRTFSGDPTQVPQNLALSPDGMLVYTLPDRLCAKDLYEPGTALTYASPADAARPPYAGAIQPDQLLIHAGRVLAVSDGGQFVRVHSLETGREITRPLGTGSSDWSVLLRVRGPHLYAIGTRSVRGYNLDKPQESWNGVIDPQMTPSIRDAFVGRQHLVLLDQPVPRDRQAVVVRNNVAQPLPVNRLHIYALYAASKANPAESGRLDHIQDITTPAGILQWQPLEGGFAYLTADQTLHLLMGAR